MAVPAPVLDPRALLSPDDFAGITDTVMDNNLGMSQQTAERIVMDALAFVAVAAANTGAAMAPSRIVDEGWHALVLHTSVYADLCGRLGGFVHHYPERPDPTRQTSGALDETLALLRGAGYEPDAALWTVPLAGTISVAASCGHSPKCGIKPIPRPPKPGGGMALAC